MTMIVLGRGSLRIVYRKCSEGLSAASGHENNGRARVIASRCLFRAFVRCVHVRVNVHVNDVAAIAFPCNGRGCKLTVVSGHRAQHVERSHSTSSGDRVQCSGFIRSTCRARVPTLDGRAQANASRCPVPAVNVHVSVNT
jgi:hypothetical protein